eukprot:6491571-Amphidinium_carterae.1
MPSSPFAAYASLMHLLIHGCVQKKKMIFVASWFATSEDSEAGAVELQTYSSEAFDCLDAYASAFVRVLLA